MASVCFQWDTRVPFHSYYLRGKNKTAMRGAVAKHALSWISLQKKRGATGCIMIDIDDTIVDGNECVKNGFELMHTLFCEGSVLFPVHIVTARPDSEHTNVMRMLQKRGFCIPTDRLHMLPSHLYGKDYRHVEEFKWNCFLKICKMHNGVIARFGDKLWDVAHIKSLKTYLGHIRDEDCYIFIDPALGGCFSGKLPGQ
jgi:hypothetical protein